MVKGSRALNPSQVLDYYRQEYTRGDYYSADTLEEAPGVWRGQLAASLGLEGDIDRAPFHRVVHGQSPDGTELVAAQAGTGKRVAGWDFQVAPDKSVSVAALALGDERIYEAHGRAADLAFELLEAQANTRVTVGGETSIEPTGRLLAARFDHPTSRALDPQLHSHFVVLNLAQRSDGAWRALEPRDIYRAQSLATAAYQAQMAHELQQLGYTVRVSAEGYAAIDGVPRDLTDHWSQRRKQILADLAERGGGDGQAAALRTRRAKSRSVSFGELQTVWRQTVAERGLRLEDLLRPDGTPALDGAIHPSASIRWASDHLAERSSRFTQGELLTNALRHATGKGASYPEVLRALIADRSHIRLADGTLTTSELVELEMQVLAHAFAPSSRPPIAADVSRLPEALSGAQRQVVADLLSTRASTVALIGQAGVGKTYALGHLRALAEERRSTLSQVVNASLGAGWEVRAYAVTTGAVSELRAAGVSGAATVAALTHGSAEASNGDRPQLWLVDESSLLGTRDAAALLERARTVDARVVLIGDPRQHHGVAAGTPFSQLLEQGLPSTTLGPILRQRSNPELLAAVRLAADGHSGAAATALRALGAVEEVSDSAARVARATELFLAEPERTLLVAPSRAERADLNASAHAGLRKVGVLTGSDHLVQVLESKDLTRAEARDTRSYAPGDHITYSAPSPRLGIPRHATGRVLAADAERNWLTVELSTGRTVTYPAQRLKAVQVANVRSLPLAVGDVIQFRRPYRHLRVANGARARVEAIGADGQVGLRFDTGKGSRSIDLDLSANLYAVDYGYAMTSHASQGSTVDRVIPLVDTKHPAELVNAQQFYVSISRARHEVVVLTDSAERLSAAVDRPNPKPTALESPDHVALSRNQAGRGVEPPAADQGTGQRARPHSPRLPGQEREVPDGSERGSRASQHAAGESPGPDLAARVDRDRLAELPSPAPTGASGDHRQPRAADLDASDAGPAPGGVPGGAGRRREPALDRLHALGPQPESVAPGRSARDSPLAGDPVLAALWTRYERWRQRHQGLERARETLARRPPSAARTLRLTAIQRALTGSLLRSPAQVLSDHVKRIGLDQATRLLPAPAAAVLRGLVVLKRALSQGLEP